MSSFVFNLDIFCQAEDKNPALKSNNNSQAIETNVSSQGNTGAPSRGFFFSIYQVYFILALDNQYHAWWYHVLDCKQIVQHRTDLINTFARIRPQFFRLSLLYIWVASCFSILTEFCAMSPTDPNLTLSQAQLRFLCNEAYKNSSK